MKEREIIQGNKKVIFESKGLNELRHENKTGLSTFPRPAELDLLRQDLIDLECYRGGNYQGFRVGDRETVLQILDSVSGRESLLNQPVKNSPDSLVSVFAIPDHEDLDFMRVIFVDRPGFYKFKKSNWYRILLVKTVKAVIEIP